MGQFGLGEAAAAFVGGVAESYVKRTDEEGQEMRMNTLLAGRSFGERGIIKKEPRALGIRCCVDCIFIYVN